MDVLKFVEQCLNETYERLIKSLQGLSPEELVWRPAPHANCIAEIVWHVARGEDSMSYCPHYTVKEIGYPFHILRGVCFIGFAMSGTTHFPECTSRVL